MAGSEVDDSYEAITAWRTVDPMTLHGKPLECAIAAADGYRVEQYEGDP